MIEDGRGKGRQRLEGETKIEMARRLGTYEPYRARFEKWIIEENRPHLWICEAIDKSPSTVALIAQSLGIFTRQPTKSVIDDQVTVRAAARPGTRRQRAAEGSDAQFRRRMMQQLEAMSLRDVMWHDRAFIAAIRSYQAKIATTQFVPDGWLLDTIDV